MTNGMHLHEHGNFYRHLTDVLNSNINTNLNIIYIFYCIEQLVMRQIYNNEYNLIKNSGKTPKKTFLFTKVTNRKKQISNNLRRGNNLKVKGRKLTIYELNSSD